MIIKVIALVSCILVLASGHRHHDGHHGGGGNWHGHGHGHGHGHWNGHGHGHHHGRHHWHPHAPFVNLEVHEPKGLTVSVVQRSPSTTFFGIELYVNHNPGQSSNLQCDVCHNTTTVTYGKFIVEDTDVVIKKGDVLYYYVLLGDQSNVTRLHLQSLWVTDSIINKCNCETSSDYPDIDVRFGKPTEQPDRRPTFGVKPTFPESPRVEETEGTTDFPSDIDDPLSSGEHIPFECDLDPATNLCRTAKSEKLTLSNQELEHDVDILKAIVEHMRTACGPRSTTNMLRLESSDLPTYNIEQLTNVVKSSLSVNPEMRELTSRIRRVTPDGRSSRFVLFDMVSYVDKQKVLYHARMNNLKHIDDYDMRQFGRPDRRG